MKRIEVTIPGLITTWVNMTTGPDAEAQLTAVRKSLTDAFEEVPDCRKLEELICSSDPNARSCLKAVYELHPSKVAVGWMYAASLLKSDTGNAIKILEHTEKQSVNPHLVHRTRKFLGDYHIERGTQMPAGNSKIEEFSTAERIYRTIDTKNLPEKDILSLVLNRGGNHIERGVARISQFQIHAAAGKDPFMLIKEIADDWKYAEAYATCGLEYANTINCPEFKEKFAYSLAMAERYSASLPKLD